MAHVGLNDHHFHLLAAKHLQMLVEASAILPAVVQQRGYQSLPQPEDLIDRGFSKAQAKTAPALGIPLWNVHGQRCGWQIRPDAPRLMNNGKVFKYELPKGDRLILDAHPSVQPRIGDPHEPLWVTEGVRKGDALASQGVCALALVGGVWGFKGTNEHGGKVILPDWDYVALNDRLVYVAYDSDIYRKPGVEAALKALYRLLRDRGARPALVCWPEEYRHTKIGVDDFFAQGHTLEELAAMIPPMGPLPTTPHPQLNGTPAPAAPPHPLDPATSLDTVDPCTQGSNAQRIRRAFGDKLHYTSAAGWLSWTGTHWRIDPSRDDALTTGFVRDLAKLIAQEAQALTTMAMDRPPGREQKEFLALASTRLKWAVQSDNASAIAGALKMAKSSMLAPNEAFDAHPWLFNCRNGTIDLQTGLLRPHNPGDLLTRCSPVIFDPEATCPRWQQFVSEVFSGDMTMVGFLQRAIGWSLTGVVQERALFFLYGPSGYNGKTTVVETIKELLGACGEEEVGYARKVNISTFTRSKNSEEDQRKMAALVGPRFVYTSEVDEAHRLNEQLIKDITGGDTCDARRLYHETFSFKPTFKAWMYGNYKPDIRGTDDAIWGRVKLVEFKVSFRERMDLKLAEALREELPGILNWALQGCRAWQDEGLCPPEKVQAATQAYRQEQDVFAPFLHEMCDILPAASVKSATLWTAYKRWCVRNDQQEQTQTRLGNYLTAKGYLSDGNVTGRGAIRSGLDLKKEPLPDDDPDACAPQTATPCYPSATPSATPCEQRGSSLNGTNDAGESTSNTDLLPLATPKSGKSRGEEFPKDLPEKGVARGSSKGVGEAHTRTNTHDAAATPVSARGSTRGADSPSFCKGCGRSTTWVIRGEHEVCYKCHASRSHRADEPGSAGGV